MNGKQIIVAAFYRFVTLDDLVGLKPELLSLCETNGIKGTILLANEGINATVSGSRQAIDQLTAYLRADGRP
jgi:UPF0176 protein